MQPRDDVPPVVLPPSQISQDIDVNQDIGVKHIPSQRQRVEVLKEKVGERNRAF